MFLFSSFTVAIISFISSLFWCAAFGVLTIQRCNGNHAFHSLLGGGWGNVDEWGEKGDEWRNLKIWEFEDLKINSRDTNLRI